MQPKNITYQGLPGIFDQEQKPNNVNLNINNAFLMVSQHIIDPKSEVTNSQLTKIFNDIQKQMEQNLEIQKTTTDNIQQVQDNKVYPVVIKAKKIDGLDNQPNPGGWNKQLSLFLRVLRQYLKDCDCELKFHINDSQLDPQEKQYGIWRMLTLNDTTNFKYCAIFKNYQLSYTQLMNNPNEISYLCDLVQWGVFSVMKNNFKKESVNILGISQSANSNSDIEVHFILDESDIEHSSKTVNFDALSKELTNTIKTGFCSNISVCQKKVTKTITLAYSQFLKDYSRGWENIKMKSDKRGIKNGQKQDYFFPFSWYGFAVDVSKLDPYDQNWLSMEENNPRAWPVGYLPATINPLTPQDRLQYSESKDKFTQSEVGSSITVYRKPEEMEQKCHIITDPLTNLKYKLAYLCRINIDTLKCPENNQNIYLISNLKDVRPYRILMKKVN
ncbi:hypothetical protein TTHERM_00616580 (macronuclear) [Tetrahymena thermophila SB210]|uniref:Uncharacterized protein n=1 Tax=Tetrahymena thermophila (strain SB210) TaxID=312017 RepID=I7MAF5_TETTS|nr:hypothetical protein TTHERM_00616580 [Tetrahymena thermophila SB210]EAS04483.2 hypothetical protein TTHERM_00616580 [Tetrahymena thermophila SB210]|eukprot:XP_001024728.2 hypothetical protein TTHERM_00616580 [Tetrahymena thermophila SB210]